MKIKHILLNSFLQLFALFIFLIMRRPRQEYIDLTILIIVLNLSTFIFMSASFNQKFSFIVFSVISFTSLIIQILCFGVLVYVFQHFHFISDSSGIMKYSVFALKQIKEYNNTFGSIKIIFAHLLFTMIPSYLVLSLNGIKVKKHKRKKKI